MASLTSAFSLALLHFVWQAGVVAVVLRAALLLLRNQQANLRYALCGAAMGLLALLPLATAWMVYEPPRPGPSIQTVENAAPQVPAAAAGHAGTTQVTIAVLQEWAVPVWSVGVMLFSLRLLWGCGQISRIRRRGDAADQKLVELVEALTRRMGIGSAVRILIPSEGQSPSVVGWMRPVVLVPAAALLNLTADQLEAVLAHELAHIRRYDYLVNLLQSLVETVLFYHPVVWWVSARMRHERELCCDDLAVACCGDAVCYARALTTLERLRLGAPALAMGSNSGSMLYRIERVLNGAVAEPGPSKFSAALALAVGLACFAVNLPWLHGQEANTRGFVATSEPGVAIDLGGATLTGETAIEYPGFARERRIEGTVAAELTLDGNGAVIDGRVVSGPAELRKVVLQTALNWHFAKSYANAVLNVRVKFDTAAAAAAPPRESAEQRERAERAAAEAQAKIAQSMREDQARLAREEMTLKERGYRASVADLEARMLETQAALERAREELAQRELASAAESQAQSAGREREKEFLQNRSERERLPLPGRKLRNISIKGAVPEGLAGRIGIHIGDVLTAESMEAVIEAVKQIDPTLSVRFVSSEGNMAELRISAANEPK